VREEALGKGVQLLIFTLRQLRFHLLP